jgi:squalene cyclase
LVSWTSVRTPGTMVLLVSPREEDSLTSRSMISYPNYKFIFPIKALGMFARRFGDADAKA